MEYYSALKKEILSHMTVSETRGQYAKLNKPITEGHTLHDST